MNLSRTLLSLSFLLLAAGRLPAAAVWFTSAPSPVESGQGYYVEAYAFGYYEDAGMNLTLYKNWGGFASGWGWTDAMAGAWTSDSGPQSVEYLAEGWDPYDGSAWAWASVTVNGTPPPANNPPNAWVEVDGYGHTATVVRPAGGTVNITVRYKAGDPDGNLARIRPQVWHPGTGLFTNDGGGWTGQGGGYGEVVRTITLDRNGDWYFWTDAEDTPGVFVNSGAWGDAFRLNVVEGAPPNSPPAITLLSPAAQTITVGTALTLSSRATDANGNLTHHHLDIQRPDGSWNWQGGFANGEPYNGGPVGSAANSTRTASFTFDQTGTWQVRSWANDSNNANQHSATVAITVNVAPDTTPPGSPQNLAVSGLSSSSFTLSWTNPGGATGYRVRLDTGGFLEIGNVLSHTFSGLAADSSHAVEVQARDAAGNWSVTAGMGVTTSSGGGGGGTANEQSIWTQVPLPNGYNDGIPDEIIKAGTPEFSYHIDSWYTENYGYSSYPVDNYWFGLGISHLNLIYGDFTFSWLPSVPFWEGGYNTWLSLVFHIEALANADYWIYRDRTGSTTLNPANFEIVGTANFPTTAPQDVTVQITDPGNHLEGVNFYLVKPGVPAGNLTFTTSAGASLGSAVFGGSIPTITLPSGTTNLIVQAKDLIGRILGVTNNGVVFSVKNALGQLINLPNNGLLDVLDIGIDQNGTWQIGVKLGGQSDGQTTWFNVNVQPATPPPGPKIVLLLHGMNSNIDTWQPFVNAVFNGSATNIVDGGINDTAPTPVNGVYCYRLQFGYFDDDSSRTGLDDLTANNAVGYLTHLYNRCGDFESFDQLGQEVDQAIAQLLARHLHAQIVLVGHSRGGIAARAFLQKPPQIAFPAPPPSLRKAAVVGFLTTSSPHQGSRMGRIYKWLHDNPRNPPESSEGDWKVVDFLRGESFPDEPRDTIDVRRPTNDDFADNTAPLLGLNQTSSLEYLPASIRYGEIVYKNAHLGLLTNDGVRRYSVFSGGSGFWASLITHQLSSNAKTYLLGSGNTPSMFPGDGLVPANNNPANNNDETPRFTQLSGFHGVAIAPKIITNAEIVHTEAPKQAADILAQLKALVPTWFP